MCVSDDIDRFSSQIITPDKVLRHLKKLYIYIIKTFLPLLLGSFAVAWFIVVMQMLWRFVSDIVGKGVDAVVFIKLMFFAAMTVAPLGLILAILLASLMTFGNLGERLELLAMRAAGIPLSRILKPLFYVSVLIGIGLFVFENDWMITSQVKFWQYYFSIKNKSPELAIPTGVFYKEIDGYSIYVERKDTERKMMYQMMLYDYQKGFQNATVLLADSGKLYSTDNGRVLVLELYSGESYSNLRENPNYYNSSSGLVPYMRERFSKKIVQIPFNTDLDMVDEGVLSSQFVGKNAWELKAYTDSLQTEIDSVARINQSIILRRTGIIPPQIEGGVPPGILSGAAAGSGVAATGAVVGAVAGTLGAMETPERETSSFDPGKVYRSLGKKERAGLGFDEKMSLMGLRDKRQMYRSAEGTLSALQNELYFSAVTQKDMVDLKYKNEFEYWRKFTYPVACIAFFLVGAPLGALIRKGGIGIPFVVAVFFFIIFYFLESTGIKMSRDGMWQVWFGMWLPNMVLIPIGLLLILLATKDSNKLSVEAFMVYYRKAMRTNTGRSPLVAVPASDRTSSDYLAVEGKMMRLHGLAEELSYKGRMGYVRFFSETHDSRKRNEINRLIDEVTDMLHGDKDILLVHRLGAYPDLSQVSGILLPYDRRLRLLLMVFFPAGIFVYLYYLLREKVYLSELKRLVEVNLQVLDEVKRVKRHYANTLPEGHSRPDPDTDRE